MKIFILHLTDIHFTQTDSWIDERIEYLKNALKTDYIGFDKAYITLTGDIANTGNKLEYEKAKEFLIKLNKTLRFLDSNTRISLICVPGNHDCNFEEDTHIRRTILEKINYQTIGEKDFSVLDTCLTIQDNFWDFYSAFITKPQNKLLYQLKDTIGGKRINFNCYNTSWMSQIVEVPGSLFYPIKILGTENINIDSDFNIAVFHHPLGWFNPSNDSNNRREFQNHLENHSNILIYGHEHYDEQKKVMDIHNNKNTIYVSGQPFQENSGNESGFQTIAIDFISDEAIIVNYAWSKTNYLPTKKENIKLEATSAKQDKLSIKSEFYENLNKISIPIQIEKFRNLALSDIFVFPDLERIRDEYKKLDDFIDSEDLLYTDKFNECVIEGDNQAGKTSLLRMLYRRFYEAGYYPIIIDGSEFTSFNYKKVLEKAFDNQYNLHLSFEHYLQYENEKKVILIDDLQKIKLNKASTINLLKELKRLFGRVYISIGAMYGYLSAFESELPDFNLFIIKPLGYTKRNELIELYHKLQESTLTIDDQILLEKVKYSFNQVEQVLGNKLLPAYPVFILSILQTLSFAKPIDLEQTSYGYCYQSLIHIALASKAKVPNEKIDTYFNFLTELSFYLYEKKLVLFSEIEFQEFYEKYTERFITPQYDEIVNSLLESHILIKEEESYKFSYKYIYYFLVAKKISDIITSQKGKDVVQDLCNNLQSEKNANILVFIAHHSKDDFLIESATFSSMVPFEKIDPITLEKHDKFYDLIKEIAEEVSKEVIETNKNPKEVRKESLLARDKIERQNDIEHPSKNDLEEDDNTVEGDLVTFYQAFRSIEIVGQIIKNRKGSLEKAALLSMIEELYLTGFRSISFFGQTLEAAKGEIINGLSESSEDNESKVVIEKRINNFFQFITLQACLGIFTKIVYSVGHNDLKRLLDEVADKINTPAAKILTFSIKSYYDRMSIRELQKLALEMKDNRVALKILRARVRAYVYNNYLDFKSKQKIATALNMEISPIKK